ncbi:hypothetical protein [Legionella longbeachae]|uniref:hypothetical protein n=1 Tax=Legionella longbeachae TaxID=450 RepID=UPI001C1497EF|nr:hypothetical protein [Legionella pneumophila]
MSTAQEKEQIDLKTDFKKYPDDFRALNILLQPAPESLIKVEEVISKNKFFIWLNQKSSRFSRAKTRMIKQGLIAPRDFLPKDQTDFARKYFLEYLCTIIIHYFCDSAVLEQVPALKGAHRKIKKAMKFIDEELKSQGTLAFENALMQSIFQKSLESLLVSDNRNIYSSGKTHEYIARELFTKRVMQGLYKFSLSHNPSDYLITEVAMDITDQFFETRMASDPRDIALKIKAEVIEENRLIKMSIKEFISLPMIHN